VLQRLQTGLANLGAPHLSGPVLRMWAAVALAGVTALTKVASGWWADARAGFGPRGRLRAGLALVARGEFSIVVAGLGVAAGIQPALGPLAAGYVLLLAIAGPLLTRAAGPLSSLLHLSARPGCGGGSNPPTPPPRPRIRPPPTRPAARPAASPDGTVARSDVEGRRSRDVHPDQIAAANSPTATATRRVAGTSTASS
jgi:hypothetical protein